MNTLSSKTIDLSEVLWDKYSKIYDTLNEFYPYQKLIYRVTRELTELCEENPENPNVLEIGCGTGNLLTRLTSIENITLIGIDNSHSMLEIARKKLAYSKEKTKLIHCDAETDNLDFSNTYLGGNLLDIAFMNLTLFNIRNKSQLLSTIYKALKNNGSLLIVDFKPFPKKIALLKAHLKYRGFFLFAKHFSNTIKINILTKKIFAMEQESAITFLKKSNLEIKTKRVKEQETKNNNNPFQYLSLNELTGLLQSCGFKVIKQDSVYEDQANLIIAKKIINNVR